MIAPVAIHVVDTEVTGLLLDGQEAFTNVRAVVVSYADFTRTDPDGSATVSGTGLYVAATIRGGTHNGDRIVAPLRAINGIRIRT
jgi:hypothetical protein